MRFSFRSNHKRHEQRCLTARGAQCPDTHCGHVGGGYIPLTTHIPMCHSPSSITTIEPVASSSVPSTTSVQPNPNFPLTLNPFTLTQDPSQSAMLDLYYKTFADAAQSLTYSPGVHLSSAAGQTFAAYNEPYVKYEPEDSTERCFRRSASCARKQPHPRRTGSGLYTLQGEDSREDIKPDIRNLPSHLLLPPQCLQDGSYNHPSLSYQGHGEDGDDAITSTVGKPRKDGRYFSGDSDNGGRKRQSSSDGLRKEHLRQARRGKSMGCHGDDAETEQNEHRSISTCTSATLSSLAEVEAGTLMDPTAPLGDLQLDGLIQLLVQNGRLYRCQHCHILFEDYATYVLHMGCHGSANPFSCHFCSRVFQEKYGFLAHFMKCLGK